MATVATLLAAADAAIDGTEAGLVTALTNYKSAAVLAASTQDYAGAIQAAQAAMACLAMTPDTAKGGQGVNTSLAWRESEILAFINRMEVARQQSDNAGLHTLEVTYAREVAAS